MIRLKVLPEIKSPSTGGIQYVLHDHSFVTKESIDGYSSVLINDVNLEVDDSGVVVGVWGYSPRQSWIEEELSDVRSEYSCSIQFLEDFVPGVSRRIDEQDAVWKVYFDRKKNIVLFSRSINTVSESACSMKSKNVEFLKDCVVQVCDNVITRLWLKVEFV